MGPALLEWPFIYIIRFFMRRDAAMREATISRHALISEAVIITHLLREVYIDTTTANTMSPLPLFMPQLRAGSGIYVYAASFFFCSFNFNISPFSITTLVNIS